MIVDFSDRGLMFYVTTHGMSNRELTAAAPFWSLLNFFRTLFSFLRSQIMSIFYNFFYFFIIIDLCLADEELEDDHSQRGQIQPRRFHQLQVFKKLGINLEF